MEINIKKYSELTEIEIQQILTLIKKGGEVDNEKLPTRFAKSKQIAFFDNEKEIIAVAAIKKPKQSYIQKISKKSNLILELENYNLEIGYVMVDENFRGQQLASKLCDKLIDLNKDEFIYATTKVQNCSMKKILLKNNFNRIGTQYLNEKKDAFLEVYIKQ